MAKKATFGMVSSESQAQAVITALRRSGFTGGDISVLFPDTSGTRDFAHEQHAKAQEGAVTGGGVLVSVHVENREEARRAKSVLEQAGATDIVSASESDVPSDRYAQAAR